MNKTKSFFYTFFTLIASVIIFEFTELDIIFQRLFFHIPNQTWIVESIDNLQTGNGVFQLIFYDSARVLFFSITLSLLFSLIFLRNFNWVKNNQIELIIVVTSCILIPLSVSLVKNISQIPCPNQLLIFNGNFQNISLFEVINTNFFNRDIIDSNSQKSFPGCYPAGHSSGGFALLSIIFLFKKPFSKIITLFGVMVFAWSISIYKISIGEHFLSHSITSMFIAWLMILIIVKIVEFFNKSKSENLHQE